MKRVTFVVALVSMLVLFASVRPSAGRETIGNGPGSQAQWTILIFMNGDNNLEPDALINFKQLARIGSTDAVNVVVQFDRIAKYDHGDGNWPQTLRFRITKDMAPLPSNALEDIGEADMGDGKVLSDFVLWGMQKFPANHYMLVIWDHGQGWRLFMSNFLRRAREVAKSRAITPQDSARGLRAESVLVRSSDGVASTQGETAPFRSAPGAPYRSVSNDETNQDVLYNRKIQDSLESALHGKKLDVIGFDACLMSMIETAYAIRNVGQYMVASEELEPGLGWKYDDWLAAVEANPTMDAVSLAKITVAKYRDIYTAPATADTATTLAAFDLGRTAELATALSLLSDSLVAKLDAELQPIIETRASVLTYAPGYNFYHIDLGGFLKLLAGKVSDETIRAQIVAVQNVLSAGVVAKYAGQDRLGSYGSTGLAIYFPASEREHLGDPYSEGGYEKDNANFPVQFVQNEKWADFLHAYWSRVP